MLNVILTEGAGAGLSLAQALEEVVPFVTKGFEFMTQQPMVYFVVLGVLGGAIGIFKRAKNASK